MKLRKQRALFLVNKRRVDIIFTDSREVVKKFVFNEQRRKNFTSKSQAEVPFNTLIIYSYYVSLNIVNRGKWLRSPVNIK